MTHPHRLTLIVFYCGLGVMISGSVAAGAQQTYQVHQAQTAHGARATRDTAIFAGGCFWSEEAVFDDVAGVVAVTVGYTGGHTDHPTYEQVETGNTGHVEAVQVVYDRSKVGYNKLLTLFWHNTDPLDDVGQYCDKGPQYRSAIFYRDSSQHQLAATSEAEIAKHFKQPIVTHIVAASMFWPAEEYHQEYHKKNPERYHAYRVGCGRDRRLKELWGDQAGHE